MAKQVNRTRNDTQIYVIIAAIALILAIAVGAIFFFQGLGGYRRESSERDEIQIAIDLYEGNSTESELYGKDYTYVADALYDLGFALNKQKIKNVEAVYATYYYTDMPDVKTLAISTARLFLENYYDTVSKNDRETTTTYLLKCFVSAVGDPYSYYFTSEEYSLFLGDLSGSEEKIGIGVMAETNYEKNTVKITSVISDSPAERAGIKRGDLIVAVDGERIEDIGAIAIVNNIAGELGSTVEITVLRDGVEITLTAIRERISDITVAYDLLDGNIGYIQIIQFKTTTPAQFREAVDYLVDEIGVDSVIFDLRNNPGGELNAVLEMIDYVVPDGHQLASYTIGKSSTTRFYSEDGHSIDLPTVVLCNGGTASAGELFTAALRDFGEWGMLDVSIVGEQTYGKGVMQSSFNINGSEGVKLTVAFYNPPCDVNYDGVGVMVIPEEGEEPTTTVRHIVVSNDTDTDSQLNAAILEIAELKNK